MMSKLLRLAVLTSLALGCNPPADSGQDAKKPAPSDGADSPSDADEADADIAIVSEAGAAKKAAAARVIRVRAEPDPASKKDDSIYRYDRAALLTALTSVAGGRG